MEQSGKTKMQAMGEDDRQVIVNLGRRWNHEVRQKCPRR